MTFWDYDLKKYSNEIKTSINSDSTWSVSVTGLELDSVAKSSRNVPASFIPSTEIVMLPPAEHEIFLNKLQEKFKCLSYQFINCNCNSFNDINSFPKLTFEIDGNS